MRILQIVHLFPPEQSAGTELYTQALSRALLARGHDCFVLAGSNQIASAPGLFIGEQDGLTVARLVGVRKRSGQRADLYDSTVEHLVRKCFALWHPDVVHLQHWLELTGNLVVICAELGIPSVVTLHDQWIACSRIHRIQPDGTFCSERETPCVSCVDRDPWQTSEEVARELGLGHAVRDEAARAANRCSVFAVHVLASRAGYYLSVRTTRVTLLLVLPRVAFNFCIVTKSWIGRNLLSRFASERSR